MNKCLIFISKKEVQIKMILKFHFTLSILLSSRKQATNAGEDAVGKGNPIQCWRECKLLQPVWK
jgi:hypothetical protein